MSNSQPRQLSVMCSGIDVQRTPNESGLLSTPQMDRPLRVLIAEESSGVGGSTISLCGLLEHLDPRQFTPFVVFSRPDQQGYCERTLGTKVDTTVITRGTWPKQWPLTQWVKRIAERIHPSVARAMDKAIALLDILAWDIPYAIRIAQYGRNKKIDVYLDNDAIMPTPVLASRLLRAPLVVIQRGAPWQSPMVRYLARRVAMAAGNSATTRNELAALDIPADRLTIIFPPLDIRRFNPGVDSSAKRSEFGVPDDVPCFGIFGNLDAWKGHAIFLRAVREVIDNVPNAMAFVVGAPLKGREGMLAELSSLCEQLRISNSVVFTGFRRDTPQMMAMMDVVVHASTTPEPFGRVIIEAMAVGRPVIATRPGGPAEIIEDGETGFLVEPGDPGAIADRVLELFSDRDRAAAVGRRAAADVVIRFSAESQAQNLANALVRAWKDV